MTDIFAILGQATAPRDSLSGTSIEDLENHLRGLLESKVSSLKAERLSFTYEFSSSARFTVSLSQSENDILEGLHGVDPVLGGARSSEAPDGAQSTRVIAANDTIMNQPHDNPTLQRMVAKHIIGSVGACDGSSWAVREVSRGPQGWSFTYICKDSMQSWQRQTGKNVQSVVGDYTEKERDPVSSSRPAFDCSGSVVVSFSRGSRNITVKYKHMPFHKTVAELYDHFAPPSPLEPLVTPTSKSAKTSRKRDNANRTNEGSSRKKSRKKSSVGANGNEEETAGDESIVVDGEVAGDADQPNGMSQAKPKRKRQYERKKKESAAGKSGQQEGSGQPAEGGSGDASAQLDSIVRVDPEEAARRRQKATDILSNAGVDPDTLSADQFNIFANQSPALQQESLAMLVEYGAERLRIVHPNKDNPAQNAAQGETTGADPTSTAQTSTAAESQVTAATESAGAPASRERKPRVTRGSCTNCRGQKGVRCGREKPACQNCIDAGLDCSYPLQQSRPKKPKSDAQVVDEPDETSIMDTQQDGDITQMSVGDATMNTIDLPTTIDQLRPDSAMDHNRPPQFDGPDDSSDEAPTQQQDHGVVDSNPYHTYRPPEPPQPEPQPDLYQEPVAAQRPQSRSESQGSRRSLPSGRRSIGSNELPPAAAPRPPETPSWGTVNPSSLAAAQSQARQPAILQSPPAPTAQMQTQGYQDIQHVAALSSAALQTTPSPQARAASIQKQTRTSPYQAAAAASNPRGDSRQGQRGQSRTPVQDATSLRPPVASASHTHPQTQQRSRTPAQPPPSTSAPYQQTSVSNAPASKNPDAATYSATSSLSGLGNYGFGFSSQNENDQSARIGYEPDSSHPDAGNQTDTSYDNFNRLNSTNVRIPATSAQTNTPGYATLSSIPASSLPNSRWPSQTTSAPAPASQASPTNQTHNTQTHFNHNMSQTTSNNHYTQNSSNPYAQKPQTQAPPYNQQQNAARAAHQQQRPQQHHHQQNWYGLNSGDAGGGDYRRSGAYVSGSYAQQGGMGMGGYGGDGDLIDLLGAVHPRS